MGMISKVDAAKQQLDTAIKLLFENVDPVSAYALAAASREITDDLFDKNRDEILGRECARLGDIKQVRWSFREEYEIRIKPEYLAEARQIMRERQNFLKHADRDPEGTIDLSTELFAMHIFTSIMNFQLVTASWTRAMALFTCWITAKYPNLLKEDAEGQFIEQIERFRRALTGWSHDQEMFALYRALQINYPEIFAQAPPGLASILR